MNTVVKTSYGPVSGMVENGILQFRGIPYAKPPVGELRFRPPQPCEPWEETRECTCYGNAAEQLRSPGVLRSMHPTEKISEDCLYLNVFTPLEKAEKCPVLFYIHGGGYQRYSATITMNYELFAKEGVIVVSANYRLGVLGFLDLSAVLGEEYRQSGNNGFLDVIQALKWVQENIAAFGGDPDNVTVFGQSSGGKMASTLPIMKSARGLFAKILSESGGLQTLRDQQTAQKVTAGYLERLNLPAGRAEELLNMPVEQLIAAQTDMFKGFSLHYFGPVVDGVEITSLDWRQTLLSGEGCPVSMLCGTNRDEMMYYWDSSNFHEMDEDSARRFFGKFAPAVKAEFDAIPRDENYKQRFCDLITEYMYRYGSYTMADVITRCGKDVYYFQNNWDKRPTGSLHGNNMQFFMRCRTVFPVSSDLPEYAVLEDQIHLSFLEYIRRGVPAYESLPEWKPFGEAHNMMILDEKCELVKAPEPKVMDNWQDVVFLL